MLLVLGGHPIRQCETAPAHSQSVFTARRTTSSRSLIFDVRRFYYFLVLIAMAAVGRGLASPLLGICFILAVVGACLAGWAINRNFDCGVGVGEGCVGNTVTTVFLPLALIATCVAIAAKFAGTHHLRVWRTDSLAAAAATALIALLLTLLAMGVAIKEIKFGGYRHKRLKALEAIIILLAFFELLYTLSLHAGVLGDKYGPTYA